MISKSYRRNSTKNIHGLYAPKYVYVYVYDVSVYDVYVYLCVYIHILLHTNNKIHFGIPKQLKKSVHCLLDFEENGIFTVEMLQLMEGGSFEFLES